MTTDKVPVLLNGDGKEDSPNTKIEIGIIRFRVLLNGDGKEDSHNTEIEIVNPEVR